MPTYSSIVCSSEFLVDKYMFSSSRGKEENCRTEKVFSFSKVMLNG